MVQDHTNDYAVVILAVKYHMRLKSEAAVPWRDIVYARTNAWKVCEQIKSALKPSEIGLGLITAKDSLSVVVNFKQISLGPG